MYLPFGKLPKQSNLANFESFRKMLAHLYTLLSRLTSGKTYLDTSSVQSCVTPLIIQGPIITSGTSNLTSSDQIANHPSPVLVSSTDADGNFTTSTPHTFIVGMSVRYRNSVYYVKEVSSNTTLKLSYKYNSTSFTHNLIGDYSSGDYLYFAYPFTQIDDITLNTLNPSFPQGTGGLAYSSIVGTKSQLYFNTGNGYKLVKLGFDGGNTYYNSNKTTTQKYSGWCHGIGHYRIICESNQIKLKFDYMQTKEVTTEAKSIVPGLRTTPISDYTVLITNSGVGLNSIDSGVITANTGYYLYFLYNPNTDLYGGILSLNADRPDPFPIDSTTATYYSSYQRLGWIQTDAAGNFTPSIQINNKMNFISDPGTTASLSFLGGGTSTSIPLLTGYYSSSSKYPYPTYLSSADILVTLSGTGVNNNNIRTLSIDNVPTYQFTSDITKADSIKYVLNEYSIKGTSIDFTMAHPQDTGGTDYTSINLSFSGFKFNKGELHI